MKTINFPLNSSWNLLYQATQDGFKASDFHSKCDNVINTLTVIKSTNGFIFGGFTTQTWTPTESFKSDSFAFLFSLVNIYKTPLKLNISIPNNAITASSLRGPAFGNGYDLVVEDQSNLPNSRSFAHLGYTYDSPIISTEYNLSVSAFDLLSGSNTFQSEQIEVYSIDRKSLIFELN